MGILLVLAAIGASVLWAMNWLERRLLGWQ
jgi:hypothetical protein